MAMTVGSPTEGFHVVLGDFQAFEAASQKSEVRALRSGEQAGRGAADAGGGSRDDDDAGCGGTAHDVPSSGRFTVRRRASLSCITARTYSTCAKSSGVLPGEM